MSVHVRQLEQYFLNSISSSIDAKDLAKKSKDDIKQATLSRSLTAFAMSGLSGASAIECAKFVCDGERDQGIDGCYFDESKNVLVFVQSKWHGGGTKTISKGDLLKFLHGVKLVLSANWTSFSSKFQKRRKEIDQVLLKPDLSVIVAVAFTGDNSLGEECQEVLNQFQQDQNSAGDFLEAKILDLKALHRIFRNSTLSKQQPFTGMLLDWGQINNPYQAVYGRICCEELAKLYLDVGESLFEPNIRSFLGDGDVNNQIFSTLMNKPEEFWYLNNGVTGICSKLSKTALGGGENRQAGTFVFQGIQFVNGAQTIGSIVRAYQKSPSKVAKAFVSFKAISLEGTPLGFTDIVTIATNKQNKVEEKDFLTLDPDQNRIKVELFSKGIQYTFRSGETVSDPMKGFDVTEAMVALACASQDIGNAVIAKRNIGMLLDRKSSAYQAVFNSSINGDYVWEKVKLTRSFEINLNKMQSENTLQRTKQILTHGNRLILWICQNTNGKNFIEKDDELQKFIEKTAHLIDAYINEHYADSYLAVFFKNTKKCIELSKSVVSELDNIYK